jgi:O-antigen/teichoic acid export membrane protein
VTQPPTPTRRPKERFGGLWPIKDLHLSALARGASQVGLLKALSAAFSFSLSVVLGRALGAEATGVYFLAVTTAAIAATVGRVGLDSAVIRHVATRASSNNWSGVREIHRSATAICLVSSTSIAGVLYLSADYLAGTVFADPALASPLRIVAFAVVPLALSVLVSRELQGLSEIRHSVMVFSILPTGLTLLGTWAAVQRWGVDGSIAAYLIALILATAYGFLAWRHSVRRRWSSPERERPPAMTSDLLRSGSPLLVGALLQLVIQMSGTVMLGIWADNSDVSQFSVAWRTALLLTFVLLAVNTIAQPKFAELYSRGDLKTLASTANKATLLMTVGAAPLFIVFIAAPTWVMSAFGHDFIEGAATLQILAIGQFVNVAAGSVGVLLVMSGHERDFRNVQIVAASVSMILNCALIPAFGAAGAATAAAAALIAQNVLFGYFVWIRLRILTMVPDRLVQRFRRD